MPVLQLSRDGAVGIITINEPPVNVLSVNVRKALLEGFAAMRADPDIEAIVLVCGGRTFIAGFDISEFDGGLQEPHLQRVLDAVEHVGKPTVAAIHGTALGGGFELAMLCSHRIAVPSAAVGLPEVKIGVMPGAGGTQRLPRVVGPELALDLMLSGRSVGGAEALKLGLIDCLAKEGQLEADAITFAGRIIEANGPLPRISDRQELVDPFRGRSEFFAAYRESRAAEFRGFNAHEAIISAVEAAVELPIAEGLQCERELCNALVETRQSLAQRHAFFAERRAAKIPGELLSGEARRIVSIRIHGNGEGAEAAARYFAGSRVPVGKFDPAGCEAGGAHLIVVTGHASLPRCVPREAIVVLTEDFVMLDDLAVEADVPESVLGLQLRSDGRRLAEVVRGRRSDSASLSALVDLLRRSGKVSVLCKPSPGLVRDRLLATLRGGAEQLREEGVAASLIDGALYDYGFRSGLLFGDVDATSLALNQTGMDGLIERLLAPVVEEGRRLIAEGIVQRASDIDIAAIHGLDWPIFTGGPMFWNATCSGELAMTG